MRRVLTALVLLPLVIFLVLKGPRFLNWLVILISSEIAWYEYAFMTKLPPDLFMTGVFYLGFVFFSYLISPLYLPLAVWLGLFLLALYFLWRFSGYEFIVLYGFSMGGVIYLALGFGHLFFFFDQPQGRLWLLVLLGVIFGTDTGAYYVGRSLGKHPLAPRVSPKKTWEGSIGGTILGVMLGILLLKALNLRFSWFLIPFLACVSVVGQLGDLFESMIKRACQVKDSGTLLPGHGGLLDRVDALIFGAPLFFWGLKFIFWG